MKLLAFELFFLGLLLSARSQFTVTPGGLPTGSLPSIGTLPLGACKHRRRRLLRLTRWP